jgi:hypothetical protein
VPNLAGFPGNTTSDLTSHITIMISIGIRLSTLHTQLKVARRRLEEAREAREAWADEERQLEQAIDILSTELKTWEEAYWREFAGTIHS